MNSTMELRKKQKKNRRKYWAETDTKTDSTQSKTTTKQPTPRTNLMPTSMKWAGPRQRANKDKKSQSTSKQRYSKGH